MSGDIFQDLTNPAFYAQIGNLIISTTFLTLVVLYVLILYPYRKLFPPKYTFRQAFVFNKPIDPWKTDIGGGQYLSYYYATPAFLLIALYGISKLVFGF